MDKDINLSFYYGFVVIGYLMIFMAGYYFYAVSVIDFQNECNMDGMTDEEKVKFSNDDILCGDFGIYWFKTLILMALLSFGIMINVLSYIKIEQIKYGK